MLNETTRELKARRGVESAKRALKQYRIAQTVIIGFALTGVVGFFWGAMHEGEGAGVGEAMAIVAGALMTLVGTVGSVMFMLETGRTLHDELAEAEDEQENALILKLKREGLM